MCIGQERQGQCGPCWLLGILRRRTAMGPSGVVPVLLRKTITPNSPKLLKGISPRGNSCLPQRGQGRGRQTHIFKSWGYFPPEERSRIAGSHSLLYSWVLLSAQDLAALLHKRRCSLQPICTQQLISLQIRMRNIFEPLQCAKQFTWIMLFNPDNSSTREMPSVPHCTGEDMEDPRNSITLPRSQILVNARATCLSRKLHPLSRLLRRSRIL